MPCGHVMAAALSGPTVGDLAEKAHNEGRGVPESLLRVIESFHLCNVSEPYTHGAQTW